MWKCPFALVYTPRGVSVMNTMNHKSHDPNGVGHCAHCKLEKDPVCGMDVDPADSAGSFEYQEETYHFCSESCLEEFKSNPSRVLAEFLDEEAKAKKAATLRKDAIYTCPMHPEIKQV